MSRKGTPVPIAKSYRRCRYVPEKEDVDYKNEVLKRLQRDALRPTFLSGTVEVDKYLSQPIEVNSCEFYCKDNAKTHHTDAYDLVNAKDPSPVLRRGQSFSMGIQFNKAFNMDTDSVQLELTLGPQNVTSRGTLITLPVTSAKAFTKDSSKWDIHMYQQKNTVLTLQIQIPYIAGVGLWRMKIISKLTGHDHSKTHECKENIYILFNPWFKEDPVYLEDDKARQEYVLSDVGKIYMGDHHKPIGKPWAFAQFETAVLPISIFLLEKSGLDFVSRGNPIKVVRAISAMVNVNDDNGVLYGNWTGNYEDGTAPFTWTGSEAILKQYLATGGNAVKYGQCWIFSGVCTTVCRAIGIPCRSVSNFTSAHDFNDSMTVDVFFDADGNRTGGEETAIWNYHVWNDCWMARPDLPAEYGGWQAIDATPQETSEGVFQTGPASVLAIKRGEVSYLYDAPFVFAEVNADVIYWQIDKGSKYGLKKLRTNTDHVGKLVATKKVGEFGEDDMENITWMYKSKEGTAEERMTVLNAASKGGWRHIYDLPESKAKDVHLKLRDIDKVMIGKNIQVILDIENKSDAERTVTSVLSANSVYYTGVFARKVKLVKDTVILKSKEKKELSIELTADEYLDKLVDYSTLKIYALSTVKETHQTWAEEDDFQVEKPSLNIEIEGQLKVNKRFNLIIYFTNPLAYSLEECALKIEGPGFATPRQISLDDIGPETTVTYVEELVPVKAGERVIIAVFWSRQLIQVFGSLKVAVEE